MKKISIYAAMAVLGAGAMTSCSSSYLDVSPKTDISEDQISDPSVAKYLMSGIYQSMNTQYANLQVNQNVGESTINMTVGEAAGADFISPLWTAMPGLRTWSYMTSATSYMTINPWMYYYNIINLSNYLIKHVPGKSDGTETNIPEMYRYKAEALTMRAHSYTRLLGYYGNRWEDSDQGTTKCIVIRTEPGTEATPLRTMNEVLDQIYKDLDEACKLYDMAGSSRSAKYEANKNVALGVWARAALIKHDWTTAAEKAKEARQGFTMMSENDLFSGFFTDNSEVMWSMNPMSQTSYYWSWGSHYAVNGHYAYAWAIGGGAINLDLYDEAKAISDKDLRLQMYWTPDKLADVPRTFNPGKLTANDFWNPKMVQGNNALNMGATNVYDRTGRDTLGYGMVNAMGWWLNDYRLNKFKGDLTLVTPDDGFWNGIVVDYKGSDTKKAVRIGKDEAGNDYYVLCQTIPFGAQQKFWAEVPYGNGGMPWMRGAEMALTEAEAQYMLGNEGAARAALNEVQSSRIPGYTSTASGAALLKEIKVCRRIELFGEGFSFLDLKRWNEPRVRRVWKANDPTSGNCDPNEVQGLTDEDIKRIQSTKYCNGWRLSLPAREYQYNDLVDVSELKIIPND